MSPPPAQPKIYHITHMNNLALITADGELLSDAAMIARRGPAITIGMSGIKTRRLSLPVHCHAGTHVGDYVPFYFCPRSVMLYVIHCANHPELAYRDGQDPIVHLEADLHDVVTWADGVSRRWAFSLSNAGAFYTEFRSSIAALDQINWTAVAANEWARPQEIKEGKQAEFLVHESFPWDLVSRIGVISAGMTRQVHALLAGAANRPPIQVQRAWYY